MLIKIGRTLEEKRSGKKKVLMAERWPAMDRVIEEYHKRRKHGKPIDGKCFKECGHEIERLRKNNKD